MKTIFAVIALLVGLPASATLTTNDIWQLDHQMGPVAHKVKLGTLLHNVETVANSSLAEGSLWVGDSGGSASAVSFKGDTKIPIGNGTTLNSVTVSGDITIGNTGVTAIGTGKVTSTMILDGTIVNADINASAAIVDTKLATISTAGKVSGSAITSGTIGGNTAISTTGAASVASLVVTTSASPAAADACTAGKIVWDASYLYICTSSGVWKRAALTGGY